MILSGLGLVDSRGPAEAVRSSQRRLQETHYFRIYAHRPDFAGFQTQIRLNLMGPLVNTNHSLPPGAINDTTKHRTVHTVLIEGGSLSGPPFFWAAPSEKHSVGAVELTLRLNQLWFDTGYWKHRSVPNLTSVVPHAAVCLNVLKSAVVRVLRRQSLGISDNCSQILREYLSFC